MRKKLYNVCVLDYSLGSVNYYVLRSYGEDCSAEVENLLIKNNHKETNCSWIIYDTINEQPLFQEIHRLQELLDEKEKQNNR
tara:strand:- start:533 stop:778 length:246 start_codon:yes stop_codon:yes gene_type:complete